MALYDALCEEKTSTGENFASKLTDVYYTPGINVTLLSVKQSVEKGHTVILNKEPHIITQNGITLPLIKSDYDIYALAIKVWRPQQRHLAALLGVTKVRKNLNNKENV